MTTRLKGFIVTFEQDIREDDAEAIRSAIRQLRGVGAVDPVESNVDDHINRVRVRLELERKLFEALKDKP